MLDIKTEKDMIIEGEGYRISLLTDRLIRLEYSKQNIFVDSQSQTVLNRKFPSVNFRTEDSEGNLVIVTKYLRLIYNKKAFSANGLRITINDAHSTSSTEVWYYGNKNKSLKGTVRTLDGVDGSTELDDGIISRKLWSILDDSNSMLFINNKYEPRKDKDSIDLYFFAYGLDYLSALKDFYKLTGNTPLLPRYALGNWWSRFYRYTQESYMALIERFEKENIPFNVAILDMDWHLTDIDPKYGTSWTGYTWNKQLFPDPEKLLSDLHKKDYKVSLNVHPADGVRAFEENYKDFAEFMGLDTTKEDPVLFNIANEKFCEGYFKYIHHRLEKQGVDFWWIDWQQGENSGQDGLDPLWLLNHRHYEDIKRNGKRGLILSRYAGPGSHRYPVGFSGDTIITWKTLDFQPYFTATASNIGYTWWSHDIGGHMNGIRDDELFVRWVQFGAFSPIMRLHSTSNEFASKEPWQYNEIAYKIIKKYLRLRQKFIPYLYTMNLRLHTENIPLILPIYYYTANNEKVYKYKNEYYFGNNLLVCPITDKIDMVSNLSGVSAYIPSGKWIDIFTGLKYSGDREIELFRGLDNIAIFAKEGSILPLDAREKGNKIDNPDMFDLYIFTGNGGEFTLAEDFEETVEYTPEKWRFTKYIGAERQLASGERVYEFKILACENTIKDGMTERQYNLYFYGVSEFSNLKVLCDNEVIKPEKTYYKEDINALAVKLNYLNIEKDISISFRYYSNYNSIQVIKDKIFAMLKKAQIENDLKADIMKKISKLNGNNNNLIIAEIYSICKYENIRGAILEMLSAN